jgi:hypothetical protein
MVTQNGMPPTSGPTVWPIWIACNLATTAIDKIKTHKMLEFFVTRFKISENGTALSFP